MHARLIPARNSFKYGIYYIALPLSKLADCDIAQDRYGLISFYCKDHGLCDGSPLWPWAQKILNIYGMTEADGEIVLVTMPRVLGYVFNPVSFWLCLDRSQNIRAVICEVHNTFGERHSYLCAHTDHRPIIEGYSISAQKLFHVSPFLEREGHYEFRFDISEKKFGAWIDYFDGAGNKTLVTALAGHFSPLNARTLRSAFWGYPLVTLKAIAMIHWQALRIIIKGIKYVPKPSQNATSVSAADNITEI
jgi:DUF1365 family protein